MSSDRFETITAVLEYLRAEGYSPARRTLYAHRRNGVLPELPGGGFSKLAVDKYAATHLSRDAAEENDLDHKSRLVRAQANMAELKVAMQRGELLDASAEEARDAAVLLAVRRHLEQGAADRIKMILQDMAVVLTNDQVATATTYLPEWIDNELERIAESFDLLAMAGGVE